MKTPFTDDQLRQLKEGLDPSRVSQRSGGGSRKLSYLEGHDVIDTANRIFGFGNWEVHFEKVLGQTQGAKKTHVVAQVRVTVCPQPGSIIQHTDVGYGNGFGEDGIELAFKEAVTDGMKRCFRYFGNQFGNSLYQKDNAVHHGGQDAKGETHRTEEEIKKADKEIGEFFFRLQENLSACKTQADVDKVAGEVKASDIFKSMMADKKANKDTIKNIADAINNKKANLAKD